ncbi:YhcN/YlaJ family sporulation lipoprotein [Anoxybacillus tepidamans]|uniref:YhcN/YlaJ family sporulation lipoprotein n=1 Tax=Anoxybacteroides tepidamans TaxID=265948 RepID=A0A7W8INH4_9BACL|nr:YhcN/YlaJ family sporulation lipoprotein [Anoxybacillus tepidamans]MBB5323825.1 YhcN/YlaJ family sporulation lipoprotein [Anoxybacillus tepidamans]
MNYRSFLNAILPFFILMGCGIGNDRQDATNRSLVHVKNTVNENVQNKSGQQIARHLANLADRVPNVEKATALVVGKYAIVGIDVNDKIDSSRVGTVKYSVAESLQKDPYGANAIIIADPDLYTRLQNIVRQVDNGRPVQAFMNEIADIVGRVMPEVPSDLLQTKNPPPTKENDAQLNKQEEKQLNNRQDKQSNHYLNQ